MMFSISDSTSTPAACASATTSAVSRSAVSRSRSEASNSTDDHPARTTSEMTARSGQWSRCSATGTGTSAAACRNIVVIRSVPIERTVLTEIWMISGELAATAAATTARRDRSSRMFTAGTA